MRSGNVGGFSLAFDGGQARHSRIEYHSTKFLYEPWGIHGSVMIYAAHNVNLYVINM